MSEIVFGLDMESYYLEERQIRPVPSGEKNTIMGTVTFVLVGFLLWRLVSGNEWLSMYSWMLSLL